MKKIAPYVLVLLICMIGIDMIFIAQKNGLIKAMKEEIIHVDIMEVEYIDLFKQQPVKTLKI